MYKSKKIVLEDEFGGGIVCTIGENYNVFPLGYVHDEIQKIKTENPLINCDGQLYLDFMKD